jgi:hypothetical protein
MNEEVDKMLNFYMTRLNERIDDSYDDSDDDEINLNNFPKLNEFMNINNNYLNETGKEKNQQNDTNLKGKNTNSMMPSKLNTNSTFENDRNSNLRQKPLLVESKKKFIFFNFFIFFILKILNLN